MGTTNNSRKLDLVQGASVLGVSPHTLRAWTRERRIAFHRCGRRIVFAMADLDQFLSDHRVEARVTK
jgi:excisionase family DNA binding protein